MKDRLRIIVLISALLLNFYHDFQPHNHFLEQCYNFLSTSLSHHHTNYDNHHNGLTNRHNDLPCNSQNNNMPFSHQHLIPVSDIQLVKKQHIVNLINTIDIDSSIKKIIILEFDQKDIYLYTNVKVSIILFV